MHPTVSERLLLTYARRFPIRRGKLRVVDALWRAAGAGGDTRRLATLTHGGFRMSCDLADMLHRQFYFFGTYLLEEEILDCWQREARGARVIFDVGANAGIFSLAALAVQPDVTVHAFEPTPEIAAELRATADLNGLARLHVHDVAIFSEDGLAALRRCRGESGTNEGMNFITRSTRPAEEIVRTVRLDSFSSDHAIDHVDLLKLDIQGQEHRALQGASDLLRRGRVGTIFTELNWAGDGAGECPATVAIHILEQNGYQFSTPGRRMSWQKAGRWMDTLSVVVARRPIG
jgi:FkbM family methyltransferase